MMPGGRIPAPFRQQWAAGDPLNDGLDLEDQGTVTTIHEPDPAKVPTTATSTTEKDTTPKAPKLRDLGEYDGTTPASRWMKRLYWEFEAACGEDINWSKFITAVNILSKGVVAEYIDSSVECHRYIKKADNEEATRDDATALGQLLKNRFPHRLVEEAEYTYRTVEELKQKEKEPLAEYYARVQTILRKVGSRDLPTSTKAMPLSKAEAFTLEAVVKAFVMGLHEAPLRYDAVERGAMTAASLQAAYSLVRETVRVREFLGSIPGWPPRK